MSEPTTSRTQEGASSSTVTVTETDHTQDVPTVTLKLKKPKPDRKVQWSNETVDNENMGRKKSKCCCIYDKPRKFGESSSSSEEDECDQCHGHVEKKKKKRNNPTSGDIPDSGTGDCLIKPQHTETCTETNADIPQPDSTSDNLNLPGED